MGKVYLTKASFSHDLSSMSADENPQGPSRAEAEEPFKDINICHYGGLMLDCFVVVIFVLPPFGSVKRQHQKHESSRNITFSNTGALV